MPSLACLAFEVKEGFTMTTLAPSSARIKTGFDAIASAFLRESGLPFASVLDGETIERVFAEEEALFGQGDVFSTDVVLWAFLAQTLRDGKGIACASAVADVATYLLQTGRRPPCGDTGDYCRARAKLNLDALRRLVRDSAEQLERTAQDAWLWKGLHAKLVDGFTFTMPDTDTNQEAFPQPGSQDPGVGFPIARACAILSLATACVCDIAIGPYEGKETGETALLRQMLGSFNEGDVAVFDRYYCSYMMLALLQQRGVHVCTRQHQLRSTDFRRGRRLGPGDHIVTWERPQRPKWMSQEQYEQVPETLTLRELEFEIKAPGCRVETLVIVTTLTDPEVYSKEDIAELYGFRWNVELDLLQIKQTLHLDHVRCKSPEMVRRELWVTLLAYNLIRKVIATSAVIYHKQPRHLGFTRACQTILAAWMLLATDTCRDVATLHQTILAHIAGNTVADRPDRVEPRALKRRRKRYPLMIRPRQQLRAELMKT